MVKLERAEKPDIWTDQNVKKWTGSWQQKIDGENSGGKKAKWGKWPQANKERINHTATKNMLEWHSYKCAYCEVQIGERLEIDHFHPKKLYVELAFEWTNLFLSCKQCNLTKGEQEPGNALKPDVDDPSEYLWFSPALQHIVPKPGISAEARERAIKTIKLYDLEGMKPQYQLYWHQTTLEKRPINLAQVSTNSSIKDWGTIREYILEDYPAIEVRAKSTAAFSLMVRSVITEFIPAATANQP